MNIKYATLCKIGNRTNNEDTFNVICDPDQKRWTGIVCDGLGGHSNGKIASQTVIDSLSEYWKKHREVTDTKAKIISACYFAQNALTAKAIALGNANMGSTMVMASIQGDIATIAHLGDSRCYLRRPVNRTLYQTKDHTERGPKRDVIIRCIFSFHPEIIKPNVRQFKLKSGDRLLICSDGLYKSIPTDVLKAHMMANKTPKEVLYTYDLLCKKFNHDNYTAILVYVM